MNIKNFPDDFPYDFVENNEDTPMFETYGEEYEKVLEANKKGNFVWTIVDGDGEDLWLIPGLHFVNRLGYIIAKKPFEDNCKEEYLY